MNKRKLGEEMEALAAGKLQEAGYEILEKNYRCRQGEIDLVAKHRGYLVFVEVKYRKNGESGMPEEAVNVRKQRAISRAALMYLAGHGLGTDTPCRFDVVAVEAGEIRIYENAFAYQGGRG